ncbi:MAG: hypothetical protein ACREA9_22560 [Pyrinomonadaceae bacterium]
MYCSSCGSAVTSGLSYCNRCGAQLNSKESGSTQGPQVPESLVWAIVAVSVGGLALIIGLMAVMKNELNFDTQLILLFSLLSFLPLLAAEIVFIWLLLSSVRHARNRERDPDAVTSLKGSTTKELGEAHERFLNEPALSVTEQPTRTLETVHRERKPE